MKLVLQEYLKTLKEKDELDLLLCDLLLLQGYTVFNRPKTGERQYGVDILSRKGQEIYLFVIKQKDINRSKWDSGPDSVRQSLNEIEDVYLKQMLPDIDGIEKIHIVLTTNGYLQAAVQPNWKGYKESRREYKRIPLLYEMWNLDDLVQMCSEYAFNEVLFDDTMKGMLRRTLYFLDEPDFSKRYFENIIDYYVGRLEEEGDKNSKLLVSFYMCITLINNWINAIEKYKLAIDFTEYTMIKVWGALVKIEGFQTKIYTKYYPRIIELYKKNNELFLKEISDIADEKYSLMNYNSVENRLLILEVVSRLCLYGYFMNDIGDQRKANEIMNVSIKILNNNQGWQYPVYDNNIIEMSYIYILMKSLGREDTKIFLDSLASNAIRGCLNKTLIPSPNDDIEEAYDIYFGNLVPEYNSSIFWGTILEWLAGEHMEEMFQQINSVIHQAFDNITCHTWQIYTLIEEKSLYSQEAISVGKCFEVEGTFTIKEMYKFIVETEKNNEFDQFSFNKYKFSAIALIASRYFHYPILSRFWRKYILNENKLEK